MFAGGTWVFVISGAMIAEVARKDPKDGAESLQSIQWGWYSLGMLVGDFSAAPVYAVLCSARLCFALTIPLYGALAFAPFAVEDTSARKDSPMGTLQRAANLAGSKIWGSACGCCPKCNGADADELTMDGATAAAADSAKDGGAEGVAERSAPSAANFVDQLRRIWRTVDPKGPTKGVLLRPVLFILFCMSCVPDYYCARPNQSFSVPHSPYTVAARCRWGYILLLHLIEGAGGVWLRWRRHQRDRVHTCGPAVCEGGEL